MKKTTIILALFAMFTASSLLAKGNINCGGGGGKSVPDAASTMALMGVAFGALSAGRRFFRR